MLLEFKGIGFKPLANSYWLMAKKKPSQGIAFKIFIERLKP